jgi:hypothetical protein
MWADAQKRFYQLDGEVAIYKRCKKEIGGKTFKKNFSEVVDKKECYALSS